MIVFKIEDAKSATNQLIQLLLWCFSIASIPPLCCKQIWDTFPPYFSSSLNLWFYLEANLLPGCFVCKWSANGSQTQRLWHPCKQRSHPCHWQCDLNLFTTTITTTTEKNKTEKESRTIGLSQAHPNVHSWEQRLIVLIPGHRESSYNLHWGELHLAVRDK